MQQGERVIVKLDPDFNPTGTPMPDTILEQMKADPDFAKLSEEERKQVISKVENMIKDIKNVNKYGTLKEKIMKISTMCNWNRNKNGIPYVRLSDELDSSFLRAEVDDGFDGELSKILCSHPFFAKKQVLNLYEGSHINAGQCILYLVACDDTAESISAFFAEDEILGKNLKIAYFNAPISGKIFSLCKLQSSVNNKVSWNDDLFIVSSIPDDTRQEAVKWYKETTGKMPKYMTKYDKELEAAEQKKNVDSFLSKWDL